ncbi:MAG: redoxin domain-containing protein [Leptospiraceae bacterium]|nr:redoxin domain-containing protein [Leptospiraceae bacterium]
MKFFSLILILSNFLILFACGKKEEPIENKKETPSLEFGEGLEWVNTEKKITKETLKGKFVVLNFWNEFSQPSSLTLDELIQIQKKWNHEIIVLVIASPKFKELTTKESLEEKEIPLAIAIDRDFKTWKKFGVRTWSTNIILDKESRPIGKHVGRGIQKRLESILQKEKKSEQSPQETITLKKFETPSFKTILNQPKKLVLDEKNFLLYVADSKNNRILSIGIPSGQIVTVFGSGKKGMNDGEEEEVEFNEPTGIHLTEKELFVADTGNHLIRRINLTTKLTTTIAGNGKLALGKIQTGIATAIPLSSPTDLYSIDDKLYITMRTANQIAVYNKKNLSIKSLAGNGKENLLDGPLRESSMAEPFGIIVFEKKLLFTDYATHSIRFLEPKDRGLVYTILGKGILDFGDIDGKITDVKLKAPAGLDIEKDTVFFADSLNNKIKKLDLKTRKVTSITQSTERGNSVGTISTSKFDSPSFIHYSKDKLYISDTGNNEIKILDISKREVSRLKIGFSRKKLGDLLFPKLEYPETEYMISENQDQVTLDFVLPKDLDWGDEYPTEAKIEIISQNTESGLILSRNESKFKGKMNLDLKSYLTPDTLLKLKFRFNLKNKKNQNLFQNAEIKVKLVARKTGKDNLPLTIQLLK